MGLSAYIFRVFIDILCPSPRTTEWDYELGDGCRSISNFLVDIYQLLLLITMVYVIYKTNGAWNRLKDIFGFVRHAAADEGGRARLAAEGAAMLAQSTQRMKRRRSLTTVSSATRTQSRPITCSSVQPSRSRVLRS